MARKPTNSPEGLRANKDDAYPEPRSSETKARGRRPVDPSASNSMARRSRSVSNEGLQRSGSNESLKTSSRRLRAPSKEQLSSSSDHELRRTRSSSAEGLRPPRKARTSNSDENTQGGDRGVRRSRSNELLQRNSDNSDPERAVRRSWSDESLSQGKEHRRRRSKETLSTASDHGLRRPVSSSKLGGLSSNSDHGGLKPQSFKMPRSQQNDARPSSEYELRMQSYRSMLSASEHGGVSKPQSYKKPRSQRDLSASRDHGQRPQKSRMLRSSSDEGLNMKSRSSRMLRSTSDDGLSIKSRSSASKGSKQRIFKNAVPLESGSNHGQLNPRALMQRCTSVGNLGLKRSDSGESLKGSGMKRNDSGDSLRGLKQRFFSSKNLNNGSRGNQSWDLPTTVGGGSNRSLASSKSGKKSSSMRNLFASMVNTPPEGVMGGDQQKSSSMRNLFASMVNTPPQGVMGGDQQKMSSSLKNAKRGPSVRNLFSSIAKAEHQSVEKSSKPSSRKNFGRRLMSRMQKATSLRHLKSKAEREAEDTDPDKEFLHIDEPETESSSASVEEPFFLSRKSCLSSSKSGVEKVKKTVRINRRARVRYGLSRADYTNEEKFGAWYHVKEIQQIHNRLSRRMKREGLPEKDFWILEGNSKHTKDKVQQSMGKGPCLKAHGSESRSKKKSKGVQWGKRTLVYSTLSREDYSLTECAATWFSVDELQDIQDALIENMKGDGLVLSTNFWCLDEPQRKHELVEAAQSSPFDEIGVESSMNDEMGPEMDGHTSNPFDEIGISQAVH